MSDRPTLWVSDRPERRMRKASRADLLAALDVEWYCMYGHDEDCVSDPHDGCHWAVKP